MSRLKFSGIFTWSLAVLVFVTSLFVSSPANLEKSFWKPEQYELTNISWLLASHGIHHEVSLTEIQDLAAAGEIVHFGINLARPCIKRKGKSGKCEQRAEDPVMTVSYAVNQGRESVGNNNWATTWAVNQTTTDLPQSFWQKRAFQSEVKASQASFSVKREYTGTSWLWLIIAVVLLLVGCSFFFDEEMKADKQRTLANKAKKETKQKK